MVSCEYIWVEFFMSLPVWARGFFVSTLGIDDETIREYIQHHEEDDKRLDQLDLFRSKGADEDEKLE